MNNVINNVLIIILKFVAIRILNFNIYTINVPFNSI